MGRKLSNKIKAGKRREQQSPEVLPRSFESCGENNKAPRFCLGALNPAERTGFEPANRFCRLHAFQACLFNHSSTSPCVCGCKGNTLM